MRFRYSEISKGSFSPFVRIRLWSGRIWIGAEAYADSGAAFSIFDGETAKMLGLDLQKGRQIHLTVGDGDQLPVALYQIPVDFSGYRFRAVIGFSDKLGVGFNLIGRATFFQEFRFCFSDRRRILSIARTPQ